jgi:serine/threonine-protein kinase
MALDLDEGAIIGEKYAVKRQLGKGAMGVVFAARHMGLDIDVALKFIKPEMRDAPDVVARFAREAKACALIKSEHIANTIDVGISETLGPYIVMEYLEGKDLGQILASKKRLGVERTCEYVMQICEGLALAHSLEIVHRDIKPSNLFVTRRGEFDVVKILDFGISKVALTGRVFGDDLAATETAHMMGTPLYMSPEQIRCTSDVDQRADIWSLGVVLRELLTGKKTFVAKGALQICALVLDASPAPLEVDAPEVPLELGEVVMRCLTKDINARFQNVAELARALAPFAPARAQVHALRAASILGVDGSDASLVLEYLPRVGTPPPKPSVVPDSDPAQTLVFQPAGLLPMTEAPQPVPVHSRTPSEPSAVIIPNGSGQTAFRTRFWGLAAACILLLGSGLFIIRVSRSPRPSELVSDSTQRVDSQTVTGSMPEAEKSVSVQEAVSVAPPSGGQPLNPDALAKDSKPTASRPAVTWRRRASNPRPSPSPEHGTPSEPRTSNDETNPSRPVHHPRLVADKTRVRLLQ